MLHSACWRCSTSFAGSGALSSATAIWVFAQQLAPLLQPAGEQVFHRGKLLLGVAVLCGMGCFLRMNSDPANYMIADRGGARPVLRSSTGAARHGGRPGRVKRSDWGQCCQGGQDDGWLELFAKNLP